MRHIGQAVFLGQHLANEPGEPSIIFYHQNTHICLPRPMIGAQDWKMLGNERRRSNPSSSFAVYAAIVREWNRSKQ
jgi:hypothetical protein